MRRRGGGGRGGDDGRPRSVEAPGVYAKDRLNGGRAQDLGRAALADQRALAEEDQLIGILRGQVEVVKDGQHANAFAREPLRPREHHVLIAQVEAGGRFV